MLTGKDRTKNKREVEEKNHILHLGFVSDSAGRRVREALLGLDALDCRDIAER